MTARTKWALGAGVAVVLLGAIWLAAEQWFPGDEGLAARLAAEAERRLGVPVTIGSVRWSLLPTPIVVIENVRTKQDAPIVIGRLEARPMITSILERKLVLADVTVKDAVLPQDSLHAFRGREPIASGHLPPGRFEFRNVTWASHDGMRLAYDGELDFDDDWRPRRGELRRPGTKPPFVLAVERKGDADRWRARIELGGGTMNGELGLTMKAGSMRLEGDLQPRGVEVADALRAFNRRPVVSGKGSGRTLVSAEGRLPGELLRSLHTQTTFRISPATVLRFDVDKAIDTFGKEHDGQTALEELTGQFDTQNTGSGIRASYTDLKARSGSYSAAGEVTTYRDNVEARGTLYLENGGEVPFAVSGPVQQPKASVSKPAAAAAFAGKKAGDFANRISEAVRRIFNAD